MSSSGGPTLAFDPNATQAAIEANKRIAGDARQLHSRCQAHHHRADELVWQYRQRHAGLDFAQLESLWGEIGFDSLRNELYETVGWIDDLRARLEAVRRALIEAHHGALENRLHDEMTPRIGAFQSLGGRMDSIASSISFTEALWALDEIIFTLGGVVAGVLTAAEDVDALTQTLVWLYEREIELINFTSGSPELLQAVWKSFSLAKDAHDTWELFEALHAGKLDHLIELPGPAGITLDLFWTFLATGDISVHGLVSAGIGDALQYGVYATPAGPFVAVTQGVLAGTAFVGTALSAGFNAAGTFQGGAWGAADKGVGRSWQTVADDADNAGNIFTDAGSVIYDDGMNGAALLSGSPTPVSYGQFTGDIGHVGRDLNGFVNLGKDIGTAAGNTAIDVSSQAVEAGLSIVNAPAGIQSHVDTFLTQHVANVLSRF